MDTKAFGEAIEAMDEANQPIGGIWIELPTRQIRAIRKEWQKRFDPDFQEEVTLEFILRSLVKREYIGILVKQHLCVEEEFKAV